ncbi:MAG: NADH-quinone oxidoreductase subunit C [Bacteroidales bacterium]|jgi:Ni,Fe-hydrogenase III large subunit
MEAEKYHIIKENPGIVKIPKIPVLDYPDFREQTISFLKRGSFHCVSYFARRGKEFVSFYIFIGSDDTHEILIYQHRQNTDIKSLDSITRECFQLHVFEREIFENTGIYFEGHPWLKPVRYPSDRVNKDSKVSEYPFYKIRSEEIHEVGVGPIHAGVIEPGHFRFQCYGEKVLHLEIQLGYQHRGIERLFIAKDSLLQRSVISECIAGDSAIGHGLAFAQVAEALAGSEINTVLEAERIIALEMERIAIHIGDIAALCGDVAYQLGQVGCEALRTIVINTMQEWCGNRFGKGLIRPGGTNYPLDPSTSAMVLDRLKEIRLRFAEIADMIFNDSGILARFENTGTVSSKQAFLSGAVGMAARSAGLCRDIRRSHPFQAYTKLSYRPVLLDQGDVYARALLRKTEIESSISVINELIISENNFRDNPVGKPDYSLKFGPDTISISLVEGWRGEICHVAVTDKAGNIETYKITDPSLHNWYLLALAVREQEISDFPVCNKSFNLSYCGNDL